MLSFSMLCSCIVSFSDPSIREEGSGDNGQDVVAQRNVLTTDDVIVRKLAASVGQIPHHGHAAFMAQKLTMKATEVGIMCSHKILKT